MKDMPKYRIAAYILITFLCLFLFWFFVIYSGGGMDKFIN